MRETKEMTGFRYIHLQKRACAIVSKTFNNLNHTECLLVISIFSYSALKGVRQVGRQNIIDSITGNYIQGQKLNGVFEALINKGYLTPCAPMKRVKNAIPYKLSYSGRQIIEIYSKALQDVTDKLKPKRQKSLTIAEYFAE